MKHGEFSLVTEGFIAFGAGLEIFQFFTAHLHPSFSSTTTSEDHSWQKNVMEKQGQVIVRI